MEIYNELYGSGEFLDSLRDQPEERKYKSYAGKDRIYISGNNIGGTISIALKNINPRELETLNMIFSMLGVRVEDMFGQIDGELVIDVIDNSWLIPLRDIAGIKDVFNFFGRKDRMLYGNRELVLDGNVLKSGRMDETDEKVEVEKGDFMYGDLPMNFFGKIFTEEARGRITGKTYEKRILLELELNKEATKNLFEERLK